MFTNSVSFYIINKSFFETKTPKLIKASTKGAKANHRFESEREGFFSHYLTKILLMFGDIYSECSDYIETRKYDKYTCVEYHSTIYNKPCIKKFDRKENDWANIILNTPTYYISHKYPILKAESEIGRAYILGYKRQ